MNESKSTASEPSNEAEIAQDPKKDATNADETGEQAPVSAFRVQTRLKAGRHAFC